MKIAFFDFDGTITKKDSLIDFIRFAVGDKRFLIGLVVLSPMFAQYILKLISNSNAKEKMISYFFKGFKIDEFEQVAKEYSLNQINNIVRLEALEKLKWHQEQGDKIVVVSASIECWLKPWCDKNNFELIATKLETNGGFLTGKFFTKNCHGIEKVHRIKKQYELEHFDYIYAYGDTEGDKAMLTLANETFYKPFR